MSDFIAFRNAVNAQLQQMTKHYGQLYRVDVTKDEIWDCYLASFPAGTNPVYKERTEHDCNCCKQFIRDIGRVVAIDENFKTVSVWDIDETGTFYDVVASAMSDLVHKHRIDRVFRHDVKKVGHARNHTTDDQGNVVDFDHFSTTLNSKFVFTDGSIETRNSQDQGNYDVLARSVREITSDAIDIVLDLIDQNSLYRGEEHRSIVALLRRVKTDFVKMKNSEKAHNYLWFKSVELGHAARFRNTAIGTLLTDISNDVDLEQAVKSFESKVAPHNYKRTSALITQRMIDDAQKTVKALGLEDALYRRFAKTDDLTINNVLFANRDVQPKMKGAFDDLKPTAAKNKPSVDALEEISIQDFVNKVLPKIDSLEVLVENKHSGNFVSLVAPVYNDAPSLFKWDNNFSWTYRGDITDSIKERVKKAGGKVDGDVRVSLSWSNRDDLDLHVFEEKGAHIHFGAKRSPRSRGHLDVDMNVHGESTDPVENVTWSDHRTMLPGRHRVDVHQFTKRESHDVGFEIEIEVMGQVTHVVYDSPVKQNQYVTVGHLVVDKNHNVTFEPALPSTTRSRTEWNIDTQEFHKVQMVMNSPNHWDDQEIGNKHWFFMLEGCYNPDPARGFYNEFLNNELNKHRKVLEVLGSKMKAEPTEDQLSGIGFSSTQRNELVCKVTGSFNRKLKIKF
jgi:hypothetical protein